MYSYKVLKILKVMCMFSFAYNLCLNVLTHKQSVTQVVNQQTNIPKSYCRDKSNEHCFQNKI